MGQLISSEANQFPPFNITSAIRSWSSYKPSRPTIHHRDERGLELLNGLRVQLLDEQCQFIVKRGATDADCESVCQWHVHSSFTHRGVQRGTASEELPRVSSCGGTMATHWSDVDFGYAKMAK